MRKALAKTSRTLASGAKETPANPLTDSADVAAYIADMSRQLAEIAHEANHEKLGCLLTLAALEARELQSSGRGG